VDRVGQQRHRATYGDDDELEQRSGQQAEQRDLERSDAEAARLELEINAVRGDMAVRAEQAEQPAISPSYGRRDRLPARDQVAECGRGSQAQGEYAAVHQARLR
jgi:hypothetical protein